MTSDRRQVLESFLERKAAAGEQLTAEQKAAAKETKLKHTKRPRQSAEAAAKPVAAYLESPMSLARVPAAGPLDEFALPVAESHALRSTKKARKGSSTTTKPADPPSSQAVTRGALPAVATAASSSIPAPRQSSSSSSSSAPGTSSGTGAHHSAPHHTAPASLAAAPKTARRRRLSGRKALLLMMIASRRIRRGAGTAAADTCRAFFGLPRRAVLSTRKRGTNIKSQCKSQRWWGLDVL